MFSRQGLKRVTAPGLPPSPALWADDRRTRVVAVARHPTWRSTECALATIRLLTLTMQASLAWLVLWGLPWTERSPLEFSARVVGWLIAAALVSAILTPLARQTLVGFLERRVFASRTVLGFTPEAIVLRTRLYRRPVVVWRRWRGVPVETRLIVQEDPGARRYAATLNAKRRQDRAHLDDSTVLALVLSLAARPGHPEHGAARSRRAIPLTELPRELAPWFTMALQAAADLTTPASTQPGKQTARGTDIDGPRGDRKQGYS